MGKMDQIPFNFEVPLEENTPEKQVIDIESLTHAELLPLLQTLAKEELTSGYKKWVGKDPRFRGLNEEALRNGIIDPNAEINRLAAIDEEEDRENRKAAHHRGLR